MKISVTVTPENPPFAPLVFRGDLLGGVEKAAASGYPAVELHLRDPRLIDEPALTRRLDWLGLSVSAIGTGQAYGMERLSLTADDAAVRRQTVDRLKLQAELAARLGALVLIGTLQGRLQGDAEQQAEQRRWLGECLVECDEHAQEVGARLALEALNRYESNVFNRLEQVTRFIAEHGLQATGVLADTFHMNIEERSFEEALRAAAGLLAHVHLPDNNRQAPGNGHLNLRPVIRTLHEIGYGGYLSMEILPLPDPETAARRALQQTQGLLDGQAP